MINTGLFVRVQFFNEFPVVTVKALDKQGLTFAGIILSINALSPV